MFAPFGILALLAAAQDPPTPAQAPAAPTATVAAIKAEHDRALIRDLDAYARANPQADDIEQAYMALFDAVIEHDWFVEQEATARRYLDGHPQGAVRPLAQIIATMARARSGAFAAALDEFRGLVAGLGGVEQEEFAVEFADAIAAEAAAAGEVEVARQVYDALLRKYGDNPDLRRKVGDDLARLDRVGKPAPRFSTRDVAGEPVDLDALKGKYVLLDFWATWCAPCIAELPRQRRLYDQYKGQGFEIVAVSLDETPEAVVDFVRARKIPWRQVHGNGAGVEMVDAYGISNIPASVLIGPDGTVLRLDLRGPALDRALETYLGKPAAK